MIVPPPKVDISVFNKERKPSDLRQELRIAGVPVFGKRNVHYFTWMAVGLPGTPRQRICVRNNGRATAILKAVLHRCEEYRNLCIIK